MERRQVRETMRGIELGECDCHLDRTRDVPTTFVPYRPSGALPMTNASRGHPRPYAILKSTRTLLTCPYSMRTTRLSFIVLVPIVLSLATSIFMFIYRVANANFYSLLSRKICLVQKKLAFGLESAKIWVRSPAPLSRPFKYHFVILQSESLFFIEYFANLFEIFFFFKKKNEKMLIRFREPSKVKSVISGRANVISGAL